jgi:sugar O-acyltransferase (sialic acid O-acetyltransferase NeuD family)
LSGKLLLFPFGGNAREALQSVFAINESKVEWDILGFIDDDRSLHGRECCGVKVLGGRELLSEITEASVLAVPGSPTNFLRRHRIIADLAIDAARFATIIHPSACRAPDASIGCNTIIMPNVVISCGVSIGNHCVILPNTVVSHDSVVGDYCCIGSNVSVSGSVKIGSNCYIGSGTKIREDISIGAGSLVGLGSNVIADIPAGVVAVGCPTKVLRSSSK